jgi:hypothetical protein
MTININSTSKISHGLKDSAERRGESKQEIYTFQLPKQKKYNLRRRKRNILI